jgi:hypothetical protein
MIKKLCPAWLGLFISATLGLAQAPPSVPPSETIAAELCCNSCGSLCSETCHPGHRFYVSAEYLLWWIKDNRLPPAVELSNSVVPGAELGPVSPFQVILAPSFVTVSPGGPDINNEERSGGRFFAGYWFGDDQRLGVEAGYLFLGSRTVDGNIYAVPVHVQGSGYNVPVSVSSRLEGAEGNVVGSLVQGEAFRIIWLAGFRWLQLHDVLHVNPQNVRIVGGDGDLETYQGNLTATDNFYGGQIGAKASVQRGPLVFEVVAKIALGGTHEEVNINGAGATEIKFHDTTDRFAVLPEVGVNVGVDLTPNLRAFVGYSFLWLSNVVRTGDQVLPLNGVAVIASPTLPPLPGMGSSDFWAQGLSCGLAFTY